MTELISGIKGAIFVSMWVSFRWICLDTPIVPAPLSRVELKPPSIFASELCQEQPDCQDWSAIICPKRKSYGMSTLCGQERPKGCYRCGLLPGQEGFLLAQFGDEATARHGGQPRQVARCLAGGAVEFAAAPSLRLGPVSHAEQ